MPDESAQVLRLWLGVDRAGEIAVFSGLHGGREAALPEDVAASVQVRDWIRLVTHAKGPSEAVPDPAKIAERGLFVYEWKEEPPHYVRVAKAASVEPSSQVTIPAEIRQKVKVMAEISFGETWDLTFDESQPRGT